ncbi:nuclear transport factor 2 family protein [Streptomyces tendae]
MSAPHPHGEDLADEVAALRRTVDALDSRARILDIGARYARGVDRVDGDLLRTCFHPDSRHKHGRFEGLSWDFCDEIVKMVGVLEHTQHHIATRSVTVDGDHASAELYWIAYHKVGDAGWFAWPWAEPGDVLVIGGRYLDRYERRDGEWRISYRRGMHEWETYAQPLARRAEKFPPDRMGQRDRSDPVYLWHQPVPGDPG